VRGTRITAAALLLGAAGFVAAASPAAAAPAAPHAAVQVAGAQVAGAQAAGVPYAGPQAPTDPTTPGGAADPDVSVSVPGQPSQVVGIILLVTILGIAPAVLLLCTSFTKIVVVLSLTRSALGTPSIPPNQVLVGLALFLSLFVMGPTLDQINTTALRPFTNGDKTATQAYQDGSKPLRDFMLKHTRDEELALMTRAAGRPLPNDRDDVDLRTLVPAFVLSELRDAFIIGFVIFVPFLVIDIIVSAVLMSLGMVMLPPSLISLPFKLLLFVLVDGWALIITTLVGSYR
jgi:flagellar biosynthetic protein FliP